VKSVAKSPAKAPAKPVAKGSVKATTKVAEAKPVAEKSKAPQKSGKAVAAAGKPVGKAVVAAKVNGAKPVGKAVTEKAVAPVAKGKAGGSAAVSDKTGTDKGVVNGVVTATSGSAAGARAAAPKDGQAVAGGGAVADGKSAVKPVAGKPVAVKPVAGKPVSAKGAVGGKVAGGGKGGAKGGGGPKLGPGGKPIIEAKPGQILLTPLRPTGSVPVVPAPVVLAKPNAAESKDKDKAKASTGVKPATVAKTDGQVKVSSKTVLNPPPLPPAPVTTDSKAKKNQAGLGVKDLEFFRDLLLAKRREIVGDMSSMEREALRGAGSNLSNLPVHMADMGTDNYEQEFTLGLVEKDRQLLREINNALAKIQNGTYGICEGTGKPISRARLEAQPWSKFSIEHVRAMEQRGFRR
jgi:RNA polymerase-binding protein DksA